MAPEDAVAGHLLVKLDVYSFGILTLEIVTPTHALTQQPRNPALC
ncbi:hypothetical protein ACP70R_021956 [Stipagrostis hirtigluma subsp. patula]